MLKFNNKNKSFTLLEVIITIFVITVGILSAYTVVQEIVFYTYRVSSRFTAAYLAKEGIEIVRNIRDTNFLDLADPPWNQNLGAGNYEADYEDSTLTSCPDPCTYENDLSFLRIEGGFYKYSVSGTQTQFKRKITITDEIDYLNVSVLIEWKKGDKDYSLTVQENLYNWWYGPS